MKEKEILIIETAMRLFAKKGFSSTSIQEIVDNCGMSKGAFYLYFKSKESLLSAVIKYYFDKLKENVNKFEDESLPPREKFEKQLQSIFETLSDNKDLIITQAREEALPRNEEIKEIIISIHSYTTHFLQKSLFSIYGKEIKPYIWDLTVLLESIINTYVKFLFIDHFYNNLHKLPSYILKRMDSLVRGIMDDQPMLSERDMKNLIDVALHVLDGKKDIHFILKQLKDEIKSIQNPNLEVTLEVIEEEIRKENIRKPVLEGMLTNFATYPQLQKYIKEIKAYYGLN
jgi:AcrR family transcriptional regulator